jgi:hypothetical protein
MLTKNREIKVSSAVQCSAVQCSAGQGRCRMDSCKMNEDDHFDKQIDKVNKLVEVGPNFWVA